MMLILNDQGGGVMYVTEDITHALRANNGGHLPVIISYGFKPQQGWKAYGMGFEKEIAPSLTAAANQGVLISYGFEPGVAQRLNPEGRFYEELSPTLRAKAGDNQVSAAIIKEVDDESTCDP